MTSKANYLTNVAIIRPILLVLLVFYHAFAPFGGAWEPISGYPAIRAYWWLDWLSYAIMLEMFVFISGYVFGFQVRTKGTEKLNAKNLIWGKFKRLMIPCIVFSLLYILLLGDIAQPVAKSIYSLVNGVGHMWFLPMLFLCFVWIWVIEKFQLKTKLMIPILIICSVVSTLPLPLRIGNAMYYMVFFYMGFVLQKERIDTERFYTLKNLIAAVVAFCVLFPTLTMLKVKIAGFNGGGGGYSIDNQYLVKLIKYSASNLLQIIYSFVGLFMVFIMVGYLEKNRDKELPQWIINVGGLCMGVYLIQQFILKAVYYKTIIPQVVNPNLLPWLLFLVTLVISLVISFLFNKTKVGRFLIG